MKTCAEPGCPSLTYLSRCEAHRKAARKTADSKRPNAHRRGYDLRWRMTRARYLKAYPLCEDLTGCIEKATEVHHLDGKGPLGPLGYHWPNLEALCQTHHAKRTATDQPGGWNAPT